MKILVLPDSFKGGMSGKTFCHIARVEGTVNGSEIVAYPISDGGEGFTELFCEAVGGKLLSTRATDANFFKRDVRYGVADTIAVTAISECAYLPETMIKNPLFTTTYGLGEVIKLAKALGKKTIYIGLGGSATNDGGAGVVCALGGKFYDKQGESFIPCGGTLENIDRIDLDEFYKNIEGLHICAFTDVVNPLLGDKGCSRIFAPQKGANAKDVEVLERNMAHYVDVTSHLNVQSDFPGAGAAGGLGYGLKAFFHADIQPGALGYLKYAKLEQRVPECDIVVTGEGKFDTTSLMGKACGAVAELGAKYEKPVVVFCGAKGEGVTSDKIARVIEIDNPSLTLAENILHAAENFRTAFIKFLKEVVR